MRNRHPEPRYRATDRLRIAIDREGRRLDWLASRVGFSLSFLSNVVAQRKTIGEADARVLAALLGEEFDLLFVVPVGTEMVPT